MIPTNLLMPNEKFFRARLFEDFPLLRRRRATSLQHRV
jgi:hypothetical protein